MEVHIRQARWVVGSAFALAFGAYLVNFSLVHNSGVSASQADWGQFGDFVGGLLNPLVAFFAFYWLTESVRIQKQELSATRAALEAASQEAARTRRADRFASLYDEVNASAFGEDMEAIGQWVDSVAREAGINREALSDGQILGAYRAFVEKSRAAGLNTKHHPLERARRNVKSWYIKCLLYFEADDLEEKHFFALITRDRASLMLQVFSMTRGQTAAWKLASGATTTIASSDSVYFEPLEFIVTRKYGAFAAAVPVGASSHEA